MSLHSLLPMHFAQLPEGGEKPVCDWIFIMIYPNPAHLYLLLGILIIKHYIN